ncbi:MAG: hypothetical protein OS112_04555 [Methanoregula sp.]|nr:MAG: hypothetical protein OS112_04555 [Methanoregula sp.]
MAPEDAGPAGHPAADRPLKGKKRAGRQQKKGPARKKSAPDAPVIGPECLIIGGRGSCTEWHEVLGHYPMIDSIQREDFPDHGASFVYLAHFYRTKNTAKESSKAQKEFEGFFKEIGYEYDYAGNFASRWFEGIGVRIS